MLQEGEVRQNGFPNNVLFNIFLVHFLALKMCDVFVDDMFVIIMFVFTFHTQLCVQE